MTDKTHIKQMRLAVQQYNKLLEKTFIDIQSVDKPARIELPEGKKRRRRTSVSLLISLIMTSSSDVSSTINVIL